MTKLSAKFSVTVGFADRIIEFTDQNRDELLSLKKNGQTPKYLILSCIDSRFNPAIIGNAVPGEFLHVANVGAIVPPCEPAQQGYHGVSTALQFAIEQLGIKDVVIMGHGKCGGMKALMEGKPLASQEKAKSDFVTPWINIVSGARDLVKQKHSHLPFDLQAQHCEEEAIGISLKNLQSYPFVQERLENGTLQIHGWHFDPELGLRALNQATSQFEIIERSTKRNENTQSSRSLSASAEPFAYKNSPPVNAVQFALNRYTNNKAATLVFSSKEARKLNVGILPAIRRQLQNSGQNR